MDGTGQERTRPAPIARRAKTSRPGIGRFLSPFQKNCGKTPIEPSLSYYEDKILGGKEAVPGSWPWHVALASTGGSQFCAGALISETHVATAAHCVQYRTPSSIVIHLGSHRRSSKDTDQQNIPVKHICSHRSFTGNTNDMAVLTLSKPAILGDTIQKVCLAPAGQELPDKSALYVTGWGRTTDGGFASEVLKQALTLSIESKRCATIRPLPAPEKVLCTSHDHGSSCHGDSGGPLVRKENGLWYLQGVVSGGPPSCGQKNWPMYYTKISQFRVSFIDKYLKGDKSICK